MAHRGEFVDDFIHLLVIWFNVQTGLTLKPICAA